MNYGFNMKHNYLINDLESNARFEFNLYRNKVLLSGDSSAVEKFYKEDYAKFSALDKYGRSARYNSFWFNVQPHNARVFFGIISMINETFVNLITSGGVKAKVKVKGKQYAEDQEEDEEQSERLDGILQANDFYDKKWGLAESYQSGLGYAPFKISIDEGLLDTPILEVIRPEITEVIKERGIIQGYKFKSRKRVGDDDFEIQEIVMKDGNGPIIQYRVLAIDGEEPRQINIANLTDGMLEALGISFLKVKDGEEVGIQTTFYEFSELSDLPVVLKNNTAHNRMFPTSPFGVADTQGLETIEDALSELLSSMVEEVRKGRIKVLISEDLVPTNAEGGKMQFNDFRMDYEIMSGDSAEGGSKIEVVQGKINSEKYLSGIASLISYACNLVSLHPITVGITGVESIDASQESQMEREKVSMRTREKKMKSWRETLESLFNLLLQTQDIMDGKTPEEYEIALEFGNFTNPSKENIVDILSKAVEGSVISMRTAQDQYHGEDLTDEEKEVAYVATLIEKGIALTPAQRFFYEEKSKELYGVSDEELITTEPSEGE